MSTPSSICIVEKDQVRGIYCHWDGYLTYNGLLLQAMYNTEEKVKELIALGDLSTLGPNLENDPNHYGTLAYSRDRNEDLNISSAPNLTEYLKKYGQCFNYAFIDGQWYIIRGQKKSLLSALKAKTAVKEIKQKAESFIKKFGRNEDKKTFAAFLENDLGIKVSIDVTETNESKVDENQNTNYKFDVAATTDNIINWIRDFFQKNGPSCNAVIGISGGKDSSIVAALCVKALGKDRVFGVLMPNGEQSDLDKALMLCDHLGINRTIINIKPSVDAILNSLENPTEQTIINLPPRIRMSTLYAVSQSMNGRVANTCNLSEDWVGYSTRYGDSVGDFSPCSNITVTEMKQIGHYLGLPYELVEKIPADGLCNKTDEDNLGFTYAELDKYIREGIEPENPATKERIDNLHVKNLFKLRIMPSYNPVETKKSVLIYTDGYSIETTDCESVDEAVILMENAYKEAKLNNPDCEPIEDYCNSRSACFADGDTYRLWSIHES